MRRVAPIHGRDHGYGGGDAIPGIPYTIADITLDAPIDTVVVADGFTQDFADLELVVDTTTTTDFYDDYDYGDPPIPFGGFGLTFNDDTGANYHFLEFFTDLTSGDFSEELIFFPVIAESEAVALTHTRIRIGAYATSGTHTVMGDGSAPRDSYPNVATTVRGVWLGAAPITKVTVAAIGDFIAGTSIRLYATGDPRS